MTPGGTNTDPRETIHDLSGRPRVVAFMNQKGGVGKTTTVVNLAAACADRGVRVLLIDMDPQAHATVHLGHDPEQLERSVYDVLLSPSAIDESLVESREGLSVLPAEVDLAAAEGEVAPDADRYRRLAMALERVGDRFDLVLIDCPPSLGLLTLNALAASDHVVAPMQAHFLALQGVGKLLETVNLMSQQVNPRLKVLGVVLCMHDEQTTHTREVVADLEDFFRQASENATPWRSARVFRPAVRRNIKLAECPSFGQTIFEYASNAPGAQDYRALAGVFLDALADAPRASDEHQAAVQVNIRPMRQPGEATS